MARALRVRWLLSEAQPAAVQPEGTPEGIGGAGAGTDGAGADGAAVELEGAEGTAGLDGAEGAAVELAGADEAVVTGGIGIRILEV